MPTSNNQISVRRYELEYRDILEVVFQARRAFSGLFAPIQITDGVENNDTAFVLKTNNTPVTIRNYSTDPNVAFGTGTSNSNRFGPRTEVIFENTNVPYSYDLAIHEGLDRHTVNNNLDAAVASRLELHSQAQTRDMNVRHGAYISSTATGETFTLTAMTEEAVEALFTKAAIYYTNNEVISDLWAFVTPELYNTLIDSGLATTSKNSSNNIDTNTLYQYKGFYLEETPTKYFVEGDVAYFGPSNVYVPFVGISTTRTIESEAFDGVALQSAAKGGYFILADNQKAVTKATYTAG